VGGDEFAVLLPSTHGSAALRFAERLRGQLSQRSSHTEGPPLTVSIGISVFDGTAATWPENDGERLLKSADTALYAAKASGRNTIRIATGSTPPVAVQASESSALGEAGRN
jgi:diguanylate cyclase (GGDEF)-like protein